MRAPLVAQQDSQTTLPWWRQLRWNLVLYFVLLAVLPLSIVTSVTLARTSAQAEQQVVNQLESVADLKQAQIGDWVTTSQSPLDVVVGDQASYEQLVRLATAAEPAPSEVSSMTTLLKQIMNAFGSQYGHLLLQEMFLYNADGVIIASTDEQQVGKIVTQQPYFEPSRAGNYFQPPYYALGTAELTAVATRPLVDAGNRWIGTLAGRVNLDTLGEIMGGRSGLGSTGETYLVSIQNNYLLTPSRFEGYPLTHAYHSEGIDQALSGNNGVGTYSNYQDPPATVLGVYRWIPELQAGLLAEQAETEALTGPVQARTFSTGMALSAAMVAAVLGYMTISQVMRPIGTLTQAATRIQGGDLKQRAEVTAKNEIGLLATAFNTMAARLQEMVSTLEERVAARTRDLEVAAEVSRQVSTNLNLDELLAGLVELTKSRFGLYHTHVYLLDEANATLVMEAGAGDPGRIMKESRHNIPLDAPISLVARAARTKRAVIINDVNQEKDFLPNPLLPDTRSELALPMILGQKVIGVLDVQSDEAEHFANDDIYVMSSLAGQVAVAVENAQAYTRIQRTQEELNRIYTLSADLIGSVGYDGHIKDLNPAWETTLGYTPIELHAAYFNDFVHPEDLQAVTVSLKHITEGSVAGTFGSRYRCKDGSYKWLAWNATPYPAERVIYFVARDITQDRAMEEALQGALNRINTLYSANLELLAATTPETLLKAFASPLRASKPCDANLFYVTNDAEGKPEWVELVAVIGRSDETTPPHPVQGRHPFSRAPIRGLLTANPSDITTIADITKPHDLLDERARQTFAKAGVRSIASIPLVDAEKRMVAVATLSWPEPTQLTMEEYQIFSVLAPQLSIAIRNQRLTAQTREQERLLRTVIDTIPDWIFTKDTQHRVTMANAAYYQDQALKPEKVVGADPYTIYAKEQLDGDAEKGIRGFHSDEETVFSSGETVNALNEAIRFADDTEHFLDTTRVPLHDEAGHIVGLLGVTHDVTERERARKRERTAYDLAQRLTTVLDPDELLSETVNHLAESFNYYHAHIYLYDPERKGLVVREGLGEAGAELKRMGHSIPLYAERSLVAQAARTLKPVVVGDVMDNPYHLPNPLLPETRSEVAMPLYVGEDMLGVLDVQHKIAGHFDEGEVNTLQIVANQLAVALANARLFAEAQRRANDLATVAEVGAQASTNLDLTQLLQNVSDLVTERFNLYHAHIYLLDEDQQMLALAAGAGQPGRIMVESGHAIPMAHEHSLVTRAARSREVVISNEVTDDEYFLPNPLLPDTRSETAVPMMVGTLLLGVLDVQADTPNRFGEIDRNIYLTLASQIAVAVSNARLFSEIQVALAETEDLYTASNLLVRSTALDDVLQALVDSTALRELDRVEILIFDKPWIADEMPTTATVASAWERSGELPRAPVGTVYPLAQFPVMKTIVRDEPTIVRDIATDERADETTRAFVRERLHMNGMAVFPLVPGDQWIGVMMGQSIQALSLKEEEIRQIHALSDQAATIVQSIRLLQQAEATAAQLRELDRLKSEFLASMSHELRTPLNSIIGYSELMIDDIGPTLDPMSLEDLKGIHSSGQYLLTLINDVLDLAKIEAGRLELNKSEVDLTRLLPEVVEAASVLAKTKPDLKLEVKIQPDIPTLSADPVRLRQIIWNLVSNAIKFTEKGYVRLFCQQKDGWLHIGVKDTGVGIPPEYHEIIFDQFRQVDGSATRKAGGTGLGLAITKKLVDLHEGDLWLESEVGKGSTFTVKLPLPAEQAVGKHGEAAEVEGDGAKTKKARKRAKPVATSAEQ